MAQGHELPRDGQSRPVGGDVLIYGGVAIDVAPPKPHRRFDCGVSAALVSERAIDRV